MRLNNELKKGTGRALASAKQLISPYSGTYTSSMGYMDVYVCVEAVLIQGQVI